MEPTNLFNPVRPVRRALIPVQTISPPCHSELAEERVQIGHESGLNRVSNPH